MKTIPIIVTGCLALLFFSCKQTTTEKKDVKRASAEKVARGGVLTKKGYAKILTWKDTSFEIEVENGVLLSIQPSGLKVNNDRFTYEMVGSTVVNAEIADLDGDYNAEILIYLTSGGSGSYGNVIAYTVDDGKLMNKVYSDLSLDAREIKEGYMGHDSFSVVNNKLERVFPIYLTKDTNANPTGGKRTILYKLVAAKKGKRLVIDRILQ